MLCVPLVAIVPAHAPDAVQDVALVEDQLNVELAPLAMLVGLALSDTLGALAATVTVADCEALPPGPVHVSTNLVVPVSAAVVDEPLVAFAPLQPPEAAHDVVLLDDHVSVAAAPLRRVLGFAVSVTAGEDPFIDTVADRAVLPPLPEHVRT